MIARKPTPVRREDVAALVRAMVCALDEQTLSRRVARWGKAALEVLHSLCTVPECDCPITFRPCPCGEADCDCPGREMVAPCPCVDREPEIVLPDRVFATMFWRLGMLDPRRYASPPEPEAPSKVTSREAMAAVMAVRAMKGEALRHPQDAVQKAAPGKVAHVARRRRNGSDVTGELRREGA